jgi:hypothetical protein
MRSSAGFIGTSKLIANTWSIVFLMLISGCASAFFHPDRIFYNSPREFGLKFRDVFITAPEQIQLHGWFLPAPIDPKGTVFFLHGNSQNISAHINSVYWLPEAGYNVFLLDYRGYGDSSGTPTIPGAISDIKIGFTWLERHKAVQNKPIFLLGQSLGASLGIYFVGTIPDVKSSLHGVILDASFSSFRLIAREKLSGFWPTWPLQYPISLLITEKYDPEDYVQNIAPVPVLIMHSNEDEVVGPSHSQRLYELAVEPKFYAQTQGRHIDTFKYYEHRKTVLNFMARFGVHQVNGGSGP